MGFRGDGNVKYLDVASGGVGMIMVVRIRGGKFARREPVFMIIQNESRKYPIRGIPDDVPDVAYRIGPKGWMDKPIMVHYLKERRVIYLDSGGHQRVPFYGNCGDHNESPRTTICATTA